MRPWQARKEKSQKIRKVEGRILYGRDGSSVTLGLCRIPCGSSSEQLDIGLKANLLFIIIPDAIMFVLFGSLMFSVFILLMRISLFLLLCHAFTVTD